MSFPIRAPLMLGAGGLRKVAQGIERAGESSRSGKTAGTFAQLSESVASQLGAAGLAGGPTPPSFGRIGGVRFRPPPGMPMRAAGAAGRALAEKAGKWSEGLAGFAKHGPVAHKEWAPAEGKMAEAGKKLASSVEGKIAAAGSKIASPVEGKVESLAKPVPASEAETGALGKVGFAKSETAMGKVELDGKGSEMPPGLSSLGGQVETVGRMFGRIGEIANAIREAMQQSLQHLRG